MIQTEHDWPLVDASSHVTNTGRMIEDMEIKMRGLLQEVRNYQLFSCYDIDGDDRCILAKREM
jgi:F-actin capping protein, beta subunit